MICVCIVQFRSQEGFEGFDQTPKIEPPEIEPPEIEPPSGTSRGGSMGSMEPPFLLTT